MSDVLKQWMIDAEAFELEKLYDVGHASQYEFENRQDDFYITLLTSMYRILKEVQGADYECRAEELTDVAQSLLIYSEDATKNNFHHVDRVSNHLYVAAIFFLVRYEAIASFILRGHNMSELGTTSAKLIYYIISGGKSEYKAYDADLWSYINDFKDSISKGDITRIDGLKEHFEDKMNRFSFDSLDDFFDTAILIHVLKKFAKNNLWKTLEAYDPDTNWIEYVRYSFEKQHILSFLPSQEDAIEKGLLGFEKAFSLKMPTSAGKSYITELVIYQELKRNPGSRILYLAPLRSLSRELKIRFRNLGNTLGFKSKAIYGGNLSSFDDGPDTDVQVLISTPESFMGMEESLEDILSRFSLVICDEGQLLDSIARGVDYELLLTRLKRIDGIRFLFLSAIIPNIKDVNTWLGGDENEVGESNYRPCRIKLAYVNSAYDLVVRDDPDYEHDAYVVSQFLSNDEVQELKNKDIGRACGVALKSLSAGPVLLFTTNKSGNSGCENIGRWMFKLVASRKFPNPSEYSANIGHLMDIAEYIAFQFGGDHSLTEFVKAGFAYHHGDLPQDIRELLEENYSRRILSLLICTTTLAEGVNLPIQTIVLYNLIRSDFAHRAQSLEPSEIKNIVGRAGRAGKQRFGLVVYPSADVQKKAFKNTVKALKNEGVRDIKGTLHDIIDFLNSISSYDSDEYVNKMLEDLNYVMAIDTMITRSISAESFEEINIEDVVSGTLAYHVGSEKDRAVLKRIFRIRHGILSQKINGENFNVFRDSGMSVGDLMELEAQISLENLILFDVSHPLSEVWINYAVSVIMSLSSFKKKGEMKIKLGKEKRNLSHAELSTLLSKWINGEQYHKMARSLGFEVNDIIRLVLSLQNTFHMLAISLVRYIESVYGGKINTDVLDDWLEMIKLGVNRKEKIMLVHSGLEDRIVVNLLFDSLTDLQIDYSNLHDLRWSMQANETWINQKAEVLSLPKICLDHLKRYLAPNSYDRRL